ncbi:succinate dehydrogenase cytochrome b560 subunit, mitochondrial-like [Anneissia japonica]|uniref:succinate dehydrogenase cytochrome b560 subunit, mitochondrial-like n=1 Tax=Anneissia japonica TaxID=1529436 RepID=UPI001425ACB5|nr:succinate dehydrogenase cytochrome b560 subunit, mitochondrial-like [Anneissia japonica]
MALLLRASCRQQFYKQLQPRQVGKFRMATTAREEMKAFWKRNERLRRPVSPHVTIWKWQLPAIMSIVHRGMGIALTTGLYGFGIVMLMVPTNFADTLDRIKSWSVGPALISTCKAGISVAAVYHTFNGVRHLMWDTGRGFNMHILYRSGFVVIGLSAVSAVALFLWKP